MQPVSLEALAEPWASLRLPPGERPLDCCPDKSPGSLQIRVWGWGRTTAGMLVIFVPSIYISRVMPFVLDVVLLIFPVSGVPVHFSILLVSLSS